MLLSHGDAEQVDTRNNLGQRPAEVSLDIRTANAFKDHEHKLAEMRDSDKNAPTKDSYAGRTPFHKGAVLLHNSRADVVFRLLQRTQDSKNPLVRAQAEEK